MKKALRRLSLLTVAMMVAFAGCEKDNNGVTIGTINGYDYVDLGLPSGTKWATCNVGATTPEEYGNYYAWGETTVKSEYTEENCTTYGVELTDISGNATYDAARANWGGSWRMPTKAESSELENYCTWTWTTQSGVNGMKVTGPNGNTIFFPAVGYWYESGDYDVGNIGYYWTSTPDETNTDLAYSLDFNGTQSAVYWDYRDYGQTVRPVSD